MLLVVLATLAAAVVRLGRSAQASTAQDTHSLRANAAARAGLEWGLYQAFKGGWTACSSASQTLDLRSDLGVWVTVQCDSSVYNEGETAPGTPRQVRVYTISALACNGTASCPDNTAAAGSGYVEHLRQVVATD